MEENKFINSLNKEKKRLLSKIELIDDLITKYKEKDMSLKAYDNMPVHKTLLQRIRWLVDNRLETFIISDVQSLLFETESMEVTSSSIRYHINVLIERKILELIVIDKKRYYKKINK